MQVFLDPQELASWIAEVKPQGELCVRVYKSARKVALAVAVDEGADSLADWYYGLPHVRHEYGVTGQPNEDTAALEELPEMLDAVTGLCNAVEKWQTIRDDPRFRSAHRRLVKSAGKVYNALAAGKMTPKTGRYG